MFNFSHALIHKEEQKENSFLVLTLSFSFHTCIYLGFFSKDNYFQVISQLLLMLAKNFTDTARKEKKIQLMCKKAYIILFRAP